MTIMRRQLTCDLFLTSANALTEEGILVNIDGNGNRVASSIFGPQHVVFLIGRNKLVRGDEQAALARIAEVAGPVNAYRLGKKTPCAESARCQNCAGRCPESICRVTTIIRQKPSCTKVTILLVNEDLGL